jgi:hypothetical protein
MDEMKFTFDLAKTDPNKQCKSIFASHLAVYITVFFSNIAGKGARHFASDDRGEVKVHPLSPRMHLATTEGLLEGREWEGPGRPVAWRRKLRAREEGRRLRALPINEQQRKKRVEQA